MRECFPEAKPSGERVKIELDWSNYATKTDLKNSTSVDSSNFDKNVDLTNLEADADKLDIDEAKYVPTNLSNLKSKVDILDFDKLVSAPVDLSKLSDVVKTDVQKSKRKKYWR